MTRAVVFAYHDVGVRCLSVLLAHGVEIPLVLTHRNDPGENVWFGSVATLAALHDLPTITPEDPNADEIVRQVADAAPDFLFSFYYRRMLGPALLRLARRGAYNMHGSLLPKYRGRAPVNWAVLHGERETGATLHRMVEKPDAGAIVGQQAVPILPDDTALDVFHKVTLAAELVLDRCLPALVDGSAALAPQDLSRGAYFGARRPEDGRIDWSQPAQAVHNLVRAVAPPYPGAFTPFAGGTLRVLRTVLEPQRPSRTPTPGIYAERGRCYADCADGRVLRLVEIELDAQPLDAAQFAARYGSDKILLIETSGGTPR